MIMKNPKCISEDKKHLPKPVNGNDYFYECEYCFERFYLISETVFEVQPSRRSWEQVSKMIKEHPELEKNEQLLLTLIEGNVGSSASSRFKKFLREQSKKKVM